MDQKLQAIQVHFKELQKEFDIYNNHQKYSRGYRFEAYGRAMGHITILRHYNMYYTIYDEDDDNSFIRPDCYRDEYNDEYQTEVEAILNITYDTGEE